MTDAKRFDKDAERGRTNEEKLYEQLISENHVSREFKKRRDQPILDVSKLGAALLYLSAISFLSTPDS